MCYVYGVTKHGMVDQLIEYFNKLEDDGQVLPLDNPFYAAIELKEHLHAAITEVVIKGTEVMNWLRAIARKTSLRGLPLRWTTPHGFRVTQSYRNKKEARVRTKISGSVHLVVYEYGKKIAPGKQISSIAPNWVHALDADLMLETIHAHRKEVAAAPFSAVHDCYGTLACHLPRLSEIVRQEFVKLFSDDLLTRFRDEIEADTGISLADLPVPSFGNLDLEEVLRSKFFFS
jgi:DNA-directed RNA polymerase